MLQRNEFTTEDHRRFFAEFCKWEKVSGGPDPQLAMVNHMAHATAQDEEELLWRAFCYIGPYNVPYGEVLWRHWPLAQVKRSHPDTALMVWLTESFEAGKITTRTERKTVRRPDWMFEYLTGAQRFVRQDWARMLDKCAKASTPLAAYEVAWLTILQQPRIGRYTAIKLIEYLRRYHALPVLTPDIRPKDAWSPRHTLAYLFPDRGLLNKDNSAAALKVAHQACEDAIDMLANEYDVIIGMFDLQVLLCEYRESWESKKQYPGRSLDSELKYARRAELEWGHVSGIWEARAALFPAHHLGEIRGWDGPRKECGQCLATHGYTWSDLLFDFTASPDMAKPVAWQTYGG